MPARIRAASVCLLTVLLGAAPPARQPPAEIPVSVARISPDALHAEVAFLASENLEGRDTPSRGLDIAAEYIAAQFRRTGIEPAGDDEYFQTAHMLRLKTPAHGIAITLNPGARKFDAPPNEVTILTTAPLDLSNVPVNRAMDADDLRKSWRNQVVVVPHGLESAAQALHPVLLIVLEGRYSVPPLIEATISTPCLIVRLGDAFDALVALKRGDTNVTLSLHVSAATLIPATVRNVIGIVPGSDPALRNQYVLLTAHYDHLGRAANGAYYPGADDDASGCASVVEIGAALAAMNPHPKRSVVLMTLFGEEEGSLGARYYAHHPVFPLAKTVADVNLEQLGRTDSSDGRKLSAASITGSSYSTLGATLRQAAALTGVHLYRPAGEEAYFKRSDNVVFADMGIPAHTVVVAYEFPDYHEPGDTPQKIDYTNMAKIDRMIAMGVILIANNPTAPHWVTRPPN